MPGYTVILDRKAQKDYGELERQGYGPKADAVLRQLGEDPYAPPYEKLCGEYRGFYSRRLNRTDRVVYEMREGACEDGTDAVVVSRMRARYRGMLSVLMLRRCPERKFPRLMYYLPESSLCLTSGRSEAIRADSRMIFRQYSKG